MKTEVITSGNGKSFTPIIYFGGIKGDQFALYFWNSKEGAEKELKRFKKALKRKYKKR